jgi:hypothetical protein
VKSRPRLVFCFLLFLVQSADSVAPRAAALSLSTCARVCLVAARGLCYRCTHARGRGPGGGVTCGRPRACGPQCGACGGGGAVLYSCSRASCELERAGKKK